MDEFSLDKQIETYKIQLDKIMKSIDEEKEVLSEQKKIEIDGKNKTITININDKDSFEINKNEISSLERALKGVVSGTISSMSYKNHTIKNYDKSNNTVEILGKTIKVGDIEKVIKILKHT